jgi:hypothetical protein
MRLEQEIAAMETHSDEQLKIVRAARELMDVQRQRFAVAARSAPTHVNRRYNVNINTCFDCS